MTSDQKSRILYNNLSYLGYDLDEIYKKSAKLFLKILLEKYPNARDLIFVCGLGGNGLDALYIAEELEKYYRDFKSNDGKESNERNLKIRIYIPGRVNQSDSELFRNKFLELSKNKNINLFQDVYAKDIPNGDLIIEALSGTGFEGDKLLKRSADVLRRIVHFSKPILAIDKAVPGYTPSLTISINYPKTKNALVIENIYPESLHSVIGPGELLEIKKPYLKSHKSKAGKIVFVTLDDVNDDTKGIGNKVQRRVEQFAIAYPTEIEVLSIQSLLSNPSTPNSSNSTGIAKHSDSYNGSSNKTYKDIVQSCDIVLIDTFENAQSEEMKELFSLILNKILSEAKDGVIINLSRTLSLDYIHLELLDSPKELTKSNSSIKVVKGFSTNIIFDDGQKKIDTSGMLFSKESLLDMLMLTSIYASVNDLKLSVLAAAFSIMHFNLNKLDLTKDLKTFYEEIF